MSCDHSIEPSPQDGSKGLQYMFLWRNLENHPLTLLHSEWPKLNGVLAILSVIELIIPVTTSSEAL